jgi:hypothetical protein
MLPSKSMLSSGTAAWAPRPLRVPAPFRVQKGRCMRVAATASEDKQGERIKSTLADLDALLGIQEEPKKADKVGSGE